MAQPRLPGPAADGWYVIIGQNPNGRDATVCMAFIVPSDAVDRTHWNGVDDSFKRQGKFGPFDTMEEAGEALKQKGWRFNDSRSLWFAPSGCTVDLAKIKPSATDIGSLEDAIRKDQQSRTTVPTPGQQQKPVELVTPQAPSLMSASEIEGIRNTIRPCWKPSGGRYKEAPIVTLIVQMNQDGTPVKGEVKDSGRYNSDPVYRAAADAAWRAVMNPKCQPWPLPPQKYNAWRTITFNFDPRDY